MADREITYRRAATRAEARLTFTVTGAEPRDVPYGKGKTYLPTTVDVVYKAGGSQPGRRMRVVLHSVRLVGQVLKVDGIPGKMPASEYYVAGLRSMEDAPAVVRDAVAAAEALMDEADRD